MEKPYKAKLPDYNGEKIHMNFKINCVKCKTPMSQAIGNFIKASTKDESLFNRIIEEANK